MKLLGHTYIFVQLKYPNRDALKNINLNLVNKYVDYLLGEHVYALKAKDANGDTMSSPSLELVLSHDFQVRKAMTKAMNEGTNMVKALEDAMKDTTVKERHFFLAHHWTPSSGIAACGPTSTFIAFRLRRENVL